jgi:hypothetical protein
MTRTAGARRISPRLLIVFSLVLGMAIGVVAFSGLPVSEVPGAGVGARNPDESEALDDSPATTDVATGGESMTPGDTGLTPGAAGMQVALDPETGEFGLPTATQHRELSSDLERDLSYSDEGLQVEYRADGSRHVNLEGRFQNHSVAHLQEDGSVDIQCVQGEEHDLLHQCPPATGDALPEE